MSIKSISSAFYLSRNTVRKYVRRYQESGLTLDQLMGMSEEKLQELFLDNQNRSRKPSARMDDLEALVPDYVKRLSRKGVTVKSLHEGSSATIDRLIRGASFRYTDAYADLQYKLLEYRQSVGTASAT